MPVIGVLDTERPGATAALRPLDVAFRQGLLEVGYVEGANIDITYRYAEAQYDRLTALAVELVRREVAVIFAIGETCQRARRKSGDYDNSHCICNRC